MDESQQKIEDKLLEILGKEILSISELSRRLNVKRYILAGYLEALREQGKVDVFKVGKAKVYVAKEKAKKGLWLIFFLALIPFFLPIPTLADISVNFTPSNKIWIIDINGI
jgi:DNA-binding transcriptional ArsR family regulator